MTGFDPIAPAPILFSRLWQGLTIHTEREVDDTVIFARSSIPSFWGVFASEYSVAYTFVLALRILRRISPNGKIEVRAAEEPGALGITILLFDTRSGLDTRIARHLPILKSTLKETELSHTLSIGDDGFALSLSLPLYRGSEMVLRADDFSYLPHGVRAALAVNI